MVTEIEALAHEAAIVLSLAFQHSITVSNLAHSVKRTPDGKPSSLIGATLDALAVLEQDARDDDD